MDQFQATALISKLGLPNGPLERAYSNSNAVWLSPTHVIRSHIVGPPGRLIHEASVANRLSREALYPLIVQIGWHGPHDWMVQKRVSGRPLSQVWRELTLTQRQRAISQLGGALRAIHCASGEGLTPPCQFGGVPVVPRPATASWAVQTFEDYPGNSVLLRDAAARVQLLASAIDDAPTTTIHGDLNLNNVLWDDGVVAVLDLEMARREAADVDLFGFLSFCADPVRAVSEDLERLTDPDDYVDAPGWLENAYPELFLHPALGERLRLYELIALAVGLRHAVPGVRAHSEKKLAEVLNGHGEVQRLGW